MDKRWAVIGLLLCGLAASGCNRKSVLEKVSLSIDPGRFKHVTFRTKTAGNDRQYRFHADLDLVHVSGPPMHVLLLSKEYFNKLEDGASAEQITKMIATEAASSSTNDPPSSTVWLNKRESFKTSRYLGTRGGQHYVVFVNPGRPGGPAIQCRVSVDVRRVRVDPEQ